MRTGGRQLVFAHKIAAPVLIRSCPSDLIHVTRSLLGEQKAMFLQIAQPKYAHHAVLRQQGRIFQRVDKLLRADRQ